MLDLMKKSNSAAAVTSRCATAAAYLEAHLDGEDAGEDVAYY